MAPQLSTVHTGRIQHKSKPRTQRIRSHRLNLDKVKEDALAELFASNSFSVADASKVALPESDDEMEDVAMNTALPGSDEDEDFVDELEDLFVGEERPKPQDYEATLEFAMETIWSEGLDDEDSDEEDEESASDDDMDENKGDGDDDIGVIEDISQNK